MKNKSENVFSDLKIYEDIVNTYGMKKERNQTFYKWQKKNDSLKHHNKSQNEFQFFYVNLPKDSNQILRAKTFLVWLVPSWKAIFPKINQNLFGGFYWFLICYFYNQLSLIYFLFLSKVSTFFSKKTPHIVPDRSLLCIFTCGPQHNDLIN